MSCTWSGSKLNKKVSVWGPVWFEDQWMVATWCEEWLTTLCGLTLSQVLQVQAYWLVLVQVKNKRERSMPVGIQVWIRQVGLVRGTRWPVGSSASRMVTSTARRSRVRFLGWASKPRTSRDNCGGQVMSGYWWEVTPSPWGLQGFTTQPLGYLAKTQSQGRRPKRYGTRTIWLVGIGLTR
jgi:hypothetical protein